MKIVALEEHFTTPMYQEMMSARRPSRPYVKYRSDQLGHDILEQLADIGHERLAHMDAAGIDVQVLSFGEMGTQLFDAPTAVAMARDANDVLHETIKKHPDRFFGFAELPTSDPEQAAAELQRGVSKLGFKGGMIHGHTSGEFLDDMKYRSVFAAAAELDVPIYLHPTVPPPAVMGAYFRGYEELGLAAWGFGMDTGVHFLRIMFSGIFDEFPGLKIILGHLGEGIPFAMHRLHNHTYASAARRGLKRTPLEYIRDNLVVTTSGNFSSPAFMCTLLALGVDNILFSVDWPYESNKDAVDFLEHLPISQADLEKISHLNAERILRL